jgi:hypothetical protein
LVTGDALKKCGDMKNRQSQQTTIFQNHLEFIKTDGTKIKSEGNTLTTQAGTVGTWVLTLTVVAESLERGGQIKIERYNFQIANQFQNKNPKRRDYVTVTSTADVRLDVKLLNRAHGLVITIGARLIKGDKIIVKIGDREGGSVGSEVFWTTTLGRLETTLLARKNPVKSADDVFVNIIARDEPKCLRLLGPTVVTPGEKFSMNLVVYEINRNVTESFTGTVKFQVPENVTGLPDQHTFTKADKGIKVFENISIDNPGIFRVGICLEDKTLQSSSNPVICEANPAERIYWGDLHAHSWGDCEMLLMHDCTDKVNPFSRHKQACLVGRFDYSAPSPMAMPDGPEREEIWRMYLEAFDENDRPGTYVPFMAMEMHPGMAGDRTIIFKNRTEQIPPSSMNSSVEKVYELYGDRNDALLETHIGGHVPYFEEYKPKDEKLVEVVSAFGNAEWLLQKNLQAGFHPAVTGASDLHLGLFGAPRAVETFRGRFIGRLNVRDSGFGNGPVGAIIADACTRQSLWKSLLERRGYATTGDRIYVKLQADDFQMGQIANLSEKFNIKLTVSGRDIIEKIDLIVGTNLAKSFSVNKPDVELDINFNRRKMPPGKWFYFRIKQVNSEYAWTAPIWFAEDIDTKKTAVDFPPWNHCEKPLRCESEEMRKYLGQLEDYLLTEGDREIFGPIEVVGVAKESMGNSAKFISTIKPENYPVTIRWFYEYQIPKIRVDWGYENFGPVDCQKGPDHFK